MVNRARWPAWAVAALIGAAACAGSGPRAGEPAPQAAAEAAGSEGRDDIEALWHARLDSARMSYTEADVRFMRGMIHHHAQALEMTRLVPTRSASESVQTLAARITNAQRDEIATMERWLAERDLPLPEVHPTAHHQSMHMPGMLTPQQMRELEQATGAQFDRLFLAYMIQHHKGAVVMVRELFATDGAAQGDVVFKFASDVQVDQSTEIARMERMLASMTGGPS